MLRKRSIRIPPLRNASPPACLTPAKGEITKAWVKLRDGHTLDADALRIFLKDRLSPLEIPRHIEFRALPLPKTAIGKLSRKDILAEDKSPKFES